MPALAEHQAAFGRGLRRGADVDLLGRFAERGNVAARFSAYRRNVRGNLGAALAATYPVLSALVGPARFEALRDSLIDTTPSCDGDLNAYGAGFAELVAASEVASEFPWLADVARLEWALQQAYAAADGTPVALDDLRAVPAGREGEVRLALWVGATLLQSSAPIGEIWRIHRANEADEAARDEALAGVDMRSAPHAVLATRDERGAPAVLDFSPGEAALWRASVGGAPLAAGLESALAEEPGLDPAAVLPRWFSARLIVGITLTGEEPWTTPRPARAP